jgi:uncharacterized protein YggT (Ycf19 family)
MTEDIGSILEESFLLSNGILILTLTLKRDISIIIIVIIRVTRHRAHAWQHLLNPLSHPSPHLIRRFLQHLRRPMEIP